MHKAGCFAYSLAYYSVAMQSAHWELPPWIILALHRLSLAPDVHLSCGGHIIHDTACHLLLMFTSVAEDTLSTTLLNHPLKLLWFIFKANWIAYGPISEFAPMVKENSTSLQTWAPKHILCIWILQFGRNHRRDGQKFKSAADLFMSLDKLVVVDVSACLVLNLEGCAGPA
jgi:hypothetical protein